MAAPAPSGKPRGSLFEELKRRHVVRVGVAYVVTAWLLLQLGSILFPALRALPWCMSVLIGFLIALMIEGAYSRGIARIDLLLASEAYKRQWSNGTHNVHHLLWSHGGLGAATKAPIRARRAVPRSAVLQGRLR